MIASLDEHGFPDAVLRSTLPVMVVFTTAWAGSFHIVRATLESMAREYEGMINSYLVDTEKARALAEQYGVRQVPTTLFFRRGEVVDLIPGAVPGAELKKKIDDLLRRTD